MRRSLAFAISGIITLAPFVASAQEEPNAADVSAARALGQEGVKLADQGNCRDAIDKLQRSEKLFHAPTTLEKLGECQVQVGKVVDGTENLNRVVRENLAANAPAAFTQAQERAKKLLAEAKPRIAKLKIAVAGPSDGIVVKLDGEVVPPANLNMNRPTDPGEHTVEASAQGYKTASAKVTLQEGGNDSVALTLEVDPSAPKVAPVPLTPKPIDLQPTTQPQPMTTQPATDQGSSHLPAYVALGVGGAGVVVGAIFGALAIGKKGNLDDACGSGGGHCPASSKDDLDSGKAFGTVSTLGFIVGGVGLAAGIFLYLTEGPSSSSSAGLKAGPQSLKLTF